MWHVQVQTRPNIEGGRERCGSVFVYTVLQKPVGGRVVSVCPRHVCGTGTVEAVVVCSLGFRV
jgi:hypothetical protein